MSSRSVRLPPRGHGSLQSTEASWQSFTVRHGAHPFGYILDYAERILSATYARLRASLSCSRGVNGGVKQMSAGSRRQSIPTHKTLNDNGQRWGALAVQDYESRALPLSYGGGAPNLATRCSTRYSTTSDRCRTWPCPPAMSWRAGDPRGGCPRDVLILASNLTNRPCALAAHAE